MSINNNKKGINFGNDSRVNTGNSEIGKNLIIDDYAS